MMAQQQKIIVIAVCMIVGGVALVAAQQNCLSKLQLHTNNYRQEATNLVSEFTNDLQKHSANAADTERFRQGFDRMVAGLTSMVDRQEGMPSVAQLSRAYFQFIRDQAELYRMFTDIRNVRGATESYFKFVSSISDKTYEYLLKAAEDCLAGSRKDF